MVVNPIVIVAKKLQRNKKLCFSAMYYAIRFNCCNAKRPILNNAHETAAKKGSKTIASLVSM